MKILSLSIMAVLLFAAVSCFADDLVNDAKIPFSFIAEGKTYPAGDYRMSTNRAEDEVTIDGVKSTKASGMVPVLTRLARRDSKDAELIFDVVGKDHYLSEIYMPDMDGFYFKSATTKHTHVSVKVTKAKR